MSRSLRRGAVAATLALALGPFAAACSAGNDAETNNIKPDTASTSLGQIKIQNVQLVTGAAGSGLVGLGVALVNDGNAPETLTSVTVQDIPGPGVVRGPDGQPTTITIPAHGAVYVTGGQGSPTITFSNAGSFKPDATFTDGDYKQVTFSFATAGESTLDAVVHQPIGYFETLKPKAPAQPAPPAPPAPPAAPAQPSAPVPPSQAPGAPGATPPAAPSGPATGTPAASTSARPSGAAPATAAVVTR